MACVALSGNSALVSTVNIVGRIREARDGERYVGQRHKWIEMVELHRPLCLKWTEVRGNVLMLLLLLLRGATLRVTKGVSHNTNRIISGGSVVPRI